LVHSPRLSVVVPFFNVEHYLHDCLVSLAKQTFDEVEVVLVDDGSLDGSAAIAKDFCRDDPRFRIVVQENQGLGPARNTGVGVAQGEYLTFVDSDDLVPRHAYARMVRSLDESGSSFVGGDARRFDSSGVRESYVHRVPFREDVTATHITERPDLVLDRMVWNKVYRRSFWDSFGYAFPAIRYEDYPVTLKAHLDAVTVDVVSAPVYYWREREVGESITQQRYRYDNLLDRVVSAEMVLALVASAPPEIRSRVHAHFAQIDLGALVHAFATVPDDHLDELVSLGRRFAGQLDEAVLADTESYERIQFHALRVGDGELLQRLATFRESGGLRGGVRVHRRRGWPRRFENQYPGVDDATGAVPRRLYRAEADQLELRTTVRCIRWEGTQLVMRGTAEIVHVAATEAARMSVTAVFGNVRVPCEVTMHRDVDAHGEHGLVGFEARLDVASLAGRWHRDRSVHFVVSLHDAGLRRTGQVKGLQPGGASWAPGAWLADGDWVQPRQASDGRLLLVRSTPTWELTAAHVDGDCFVLEGRIPGAGPTASLVLTRTGADDRAVQSPLEVVGEAFRGRLPLALLTDAANPDDPFTEQTTRTVRMVTPGREDLLIVTGLERDVTAYHDGRRLALTRSKGNVLTYVELPAHPIVDDVLVEDDLLVVDGELVAAAPSLVWRWWTTSGQPVDLPCAVTAADGRWSACVALDALCDLREAAIDARTGTANWSLQDAAATGGLLGVMCDSFLRTRLPLELVHAGREVSVTPPAGLLHVEVR
jgi:glycosyltransferase involved in cell wall biosynthesis